MSVSVIRDPLYGTITLSGVVEQLVDTAAFQRLGRIRQLGSAHVVYRSAVHTRFEHSLGAYHLAQTMLRRLGERGELAGIATEDIELIPLAVALHDIGHYSSAHFLEEAGVEDACHEEAGAAWLTSGPMGEILERTGIPNAAAKITALATHRSSNPLGGIVSGAVDADKVDYIARDAYHCGLPVGFDRHGLIDGLTLVRDPGTDVLTVGLREEALPAFEQMLFAKFVLYRSVLFNPTVRAATVMMRKLVVAAFEAELLDMSQLREWTDEELFILLRERVHRRKRNPGTRELVGRLTARLTDRELYVHAGSMPLSRAPRLTARELIATEGAMAASLGLEPGEALLDIPHRPSMLSTDVLVQRTSGEVVHAGSFTPDDGFALNAANQAFYHASGRVGLYTSTSIKLQPDQFAALLESTVRSVRAEQSADLTTSASMPSPTTGHARVERILQGAGDVVGRLPGRPLRR